MAKEPEFAYPTEMLQWRWKELARRIEAEDPIAYDAAHTLRALPDGKASGNMAAFAWLMSQSRKGSGQDYAHCIASHLHAPKGDVHVSIFMAQAIQDRAARHLRFKGHAGTQFFQWEKPVQQKKWAVAAAQYMVKLIEEGELVRLGQTQLNRTGEYLIHRFGKAASYRMEDGNPFFIRKPEDS